MTNNVGNPDPGLGQTPKCGRIKPVNETQYPLDTWISNGNTYINKREKKPAQTRFHSKRPDTMTTMKDNISMDSTIAGSNQVHSELTTSCFSTKNKLPDSIPFPNESTCPPAQSVECVTVV